MSPDASKTGQPDSAEKTWSHYMTEAYFYRKPPPLGTFAFSKIEQLAREKLKDHPSAFSSPFCVTLSYHYDTDAFMYVFGSAGTSSANIGNCQELEKWRIIPRMLRDATVRNLDVSDFIEVGEI